MYIIDRFEGDFAVIEYGEGKVFQLPKIILPANAKEGDVLTLTIEVDREAKKERTKRIQDLMDNLFD